MADNACNVYLPNHCRPLQTDAPSVYMHILREAHRFEHFWTEHAAISNFDPFLELRVESEDLQGRLDSTDQGLEPQHVNEGSPPCRGYTLA